MRLHKHKLFKPIFICDDGRRLQPTHAPLWKHTLVIVALVDGGGGGIDVLVVVSVVVVVVVWVVVWVVVVVLIVVILVVVVVVFIVVVVVVVVLVVVAVVIYWYCSYDSVCAWEHLGTTETRAQLQLQHQNKYNSH